MSPRHPSFFVRTLYLTLALGAFCALGATPILDLALSALLSSAVVCSFAVGRLMRPRGFVPNDGEALHGCASVPQSTSAPIWREIDAHRDLLHLLRGDPDTHRSSHVGMPGEGKRHGT